MSIYEVYIYIYIYIYTYKYIHTLCAVMINRTCFKTLIRNVFIYKHTYSEL